VTTKQRGRPKLDEQAINQKRAMIVASAKHLFRESGVEAVSMRKIAAESGVGTMTLYKYFATKREILHFIWLEFFDELFGVIAECPQQLDAFERLSWKCNQYLDYWIEHPDRYRMVFLNEDRADSGDDFFVNHADIEAKFNQFFLQDLIAVTQTNSEETLTLSHEVMCLLNGIALNTITISEYAWQPGRQILQSYLARLPH
tara:strand:- start:5730 stop:6332 length:603 start_codon:yes stop_codon:yes gene_type:complete